MTVKEYWEEAGRLRRRIDRKQNEIKSLRERAEGMTGAGFSDMPHTVSPDFNKMQSIMGKIIELENEVADIKAELYALTIPMRESIEAVTDDDTHDILVKRYIEFKPWRDIVREMNCSESVCFRLHRRILPEIKIDSTRQSQTVANS